MKVMIIEHLDFIAGLFTLSAVWALGNKNKNGFLLGVASNILWIAYSLTNGHTHGIILECIPLLFLNTYNYFKWRGTHLPSIKTLWFKLRYDNRVFNPWTKYGLNQRCEACHKRKFRLREASLYWICYSNTCAETIERWEKKSYEEWIARARECSQFGDFE